MGTVSVKLSGALEARLAAMAAERRLSKSALIRGALERELAGKRRRSIGSFGTLAADLVGCVAGAVDLSYNRQRLRGYGR